MKKHSSSLFCLWSLYGSVISQNFNPYLFVELGQTTKSRSNEVKFLWISRGEIEIKIKKKGVKDSKLKGRKKNTKMNDGEIRDEKREKGRDMREIM